MSTHTALSRLLNIQFLELCNHILGGSGSLDLTIDMENSSVFTDIERPSLRQAAVLMNDAVSASCPFTGVAQNGVVSVQGFGESSVFFSGVAASGEVGDVKGSQDGAILTE